MTEKTRLIKKFWSVHKNEVDDTIPILSLNTSRRCTGALVQNTYRDLRNFQAIKRNMNINMKMAGVGCKEREQNLSRDVATLEQKVENCKTL